MDEYRCITYLSFSESVGRLTALHLACLHNRIEVISMLLQAGAGEVQIRRIVLSFPPPLPASTMMTQMSSSNPLLITCLAVSVPEGCSYSVVVIAHLLNHECLASYSNFFLVLQSTYFSRRPTNIFLWPANYFYLFEQGRRKE